MHPKTLAMISNITCYQIPENKNLYIPMTYNLCSWNSIIKEPKTKTYMCLHKSLRLSIWHLKIINIHSIKTEIVGHLFHCCTHSRLLLKCSHLQW